MGIARQDVATLGPGWNKTLLNYALAMRELDKLPISNRNSWKFLGAIHGFDQQQWAGLGLIRPNDPVPADLTNDTYGNQCQHGSWFFRIGRPSPVWRSCRSRAGRDLRLSVPGDGRLRQYRRLAYFYVKHGQPVPFDIALLGAMKVTRQRDGTPQLHIPAVGARKHWKGKSKSPAAVTAATKATKAWIAGRCPWLGLGWDYVGLARPDWATLVDGLVDHASEIRRSGFTVLPKQTGLALAESWKLQLR